MFHLIQILDFTVEKTVRKNLSDSPNISPLFMEFKGEFIDDLVIL